MDSAPCTVQQSKTQNADKTKKENNLTNSSLKFLKTASSFSFGVAHISDHLSMTMEQSAKCWQHQPF